MEEFLKSLGITGNFTIDKGSLIMDIKDSNAYGTIFSKLENSDEVEQEDNASNVTLESSSIQFSNDIYLITLLGDFEADTYKLVMREI